jgi:hypothetical protein
MTVENKHLHIITWLVQLVSTMIYVFFVFSVYLTNIYERLTPNIDKDYYTIGLGVLYIFALIYPNLLKLHYLYYSDTGDMLTIKTYPLGFFTSGKKSYKIPKKDFVRAELKESFFRLRKILILYQRIGKKVAKYPPLYINSLPKEDQKKILLSLSRLMTARGAVIQQ